MIPRHVLIELSDTAAEGACDVIVCMEDGSHYTAVFVTMPYLECQMQLGHQLSGDLPFGHPVRYTCLETPHIVVDNLERHTVEDVIDTMCELGTFECCFTPVKGEAASGGGRSVAERCQEMLGLAIDEVLTVHDTA